MTQTDDGGVLVRTLGNSSSLVLFGIIRHPSRVSVTDMCDYA